MTKVRCLSCGNVEDRGIFRKMPAGGRVCPECCAQYQQRFETVEEYNGGCRGP